MGALFIFIFFSVLVISALLFFNKGEKAKEIKRILKDIYENFKELFSNLKKLFLIIKELVQSKLAQEPTQLKDESAKEDSPKPASSIQPEINSTSELDTSDENSTNEASQTQTDVIPEPEINSTSELDTSDEDSMKTNNTDTKIV